MKENLFDMDANLGDGWVSDNKEKPDRHTSTEIKIPEKHQLYFAKEKRRGKTVTIVQPFHLETSELKILLKRLKKRLGTGGATKGNTLEFQGDIPKQLRTQLESMCYRFRT